MLQIESSELVKELEKKMTLCQLEIGTFRRNLEKDTQKKGSNNLEKLIKSPAKLRGFWKCQSEKN